MVFQIDYFENYCEECCEKYVDTYVKWCKPCQVNCLKNNFINWTSNNEKIDDFIKEKQLSISSLVDKVFEWIPYNQLNNIKKMKSDFAMAVWKDGPLYYNKYKKKWIRESDQKVVLKRILQNASIDEFLNMV